MVVGPGVDSGEGFACSFCGMRWITENHVFEHEVRLHIGNIAGFTEWGVLDI